MICQPLSLDVNGREVLTTEVTYNDLVILYSSFVEKHGRVPLYRECVHKNNLPQSRIINRILKEEGVDYNDFLLQFGKVEHVRTPSDETKYQYYVDKFIDVCNFLGRTLTSSELFNNPYGLPNVNWFIKYCPHDEITTYREFLDYYGLEQNKHIWTKDEVAEKLIELEQRLERPIKKTDLTVATAGVSEIVVNRLYGGLKNAKKELGLLKTPPRQPKSFEYYKNLITEIVLDYKSQTDKDYITWQDIESGEYSTEKANHKSLRAAFERAEVDFDSYLLSLGCQLNPNAIAHTYTFEDGERADSNYEYEISTFLRSLGLKYNQDYYRTIKYSTFSDEESNINCDYLIIRNGRDFYIEVAGIINSYRGKWREKYFPTPMETNYKNKMIYKEQLLQENNLRYLFLFANDIRSGAYKNMIREFINL